jgi:hypothetical protein
MKNDFEILESLILNIASNTHLKNLSNDMYLPSKVNP